MDATVRMVDGQLVLDDSTAVGMVAAVDAYNRQEAQKACAATRSQQADRIAHFTRRIRERGLTPDDVVVVVVCVDDPNGRELADMLMPGHDWQSYRDRGEVPYARGLVDREGIQEVLGFIDPQAADVLRGMVGRVAVVVVDHGTGAVFEELV